MIVEDLAALDKISEDKIINEIRERLTNGDSYTFIGDVLLSLNSNELPKEYPRSVRPFSWSLLILCKLIQKFIFLFPVSQQIRLQIAFREFATHILGGWQCIRRYAASRRAAAHYICWRKSFGKNDKFAAGHQASNVSGRWQQRMRWTHHGRTECRSRIGQCWHTAERGFHTMCTANAVDLRTNWQNQRSHFLDLFIG